MFRYLNIEKFFNVCNKTCCNSGGLKPNVYSSFRKKKERNLSKNMCSSTWNLHQNGNISFHFFCSHRNYVDVFITLLLLWILHLCIQCYVQEMSQIIMSKLNQLQIQIKYIHYAIIRRLCVHVKVCILCLCRGFLTVVPAL